MVQCLENNAFEKKQLYQRFFGSNSNLFEDDLKFDLEVKFQGYLKHGFNFLNHGFMSFHLKNSYSIFINVVLRLFS